MAMYNDETEHLSASPVPGRGGGGFGAKVKSFFFFLVFLGLGFGLLYMVAERNARKYFLVAEEGHLVVKRGIFFPRGEKPFLPDDEELVRTYAPVPLPDEGYPGRGESFDERSELDQRLFGLLLGWAEERINSEDPGALERGIEYLRRAERLPVYTEGGREALEALNAEVAYHEARRLLTEALDALNLAADKLGRAAAADKDRAGETHTLRSTLDWHVRALGRTLSGRELPAPPGTEPAPPEAADPDSPAPAPVPERRPAPASAPAPEPARVAEPPGRDPSLVPVAPPEPAPAPTP